MTANTKNGNGSDQADITKARYGFFVVALGIIALVVVLFIVLQSFKVATDAAAILGPVTTAIAALAGAFFGVNLGQAGAAKAMEEREWLLSAFDPSERPQVGLRSREWTAIALTEEVVREMARCLREIKAGQAPR